MADVKSKAVSRTLMITLLYFQSTHLCIRGIHKKQSFKVGAIEFGRVMC